MSIVEDLIYKIIEMDPQLMFVKLAENRWMIPSYSNAPAIEAITLEEVLRKRYFYLLASKKLASSENRTVSEA